MRRLANSGAVLLMCLPACGCLVWPHTSRPFDRSPIGPDRPTIVDTATGRRIGDAQFIVLIRRAAGYFPDSARGLDLAPRVDVLSARDLPGLSYTYAEVVVFLWPFFAHVYGSSDYSLAGVFLYRPGYAAVRLTEWDAAAIPDRVGLAPIDRETGQCRLLDIVADGVEPRFKQGVRYELARQLR